jgi:hypothetical protein
MVGANAKNSLSNFSRQMPIAQVPSKPHQLIAIFMPDFDHKFGCRSNLEPPSVFQLQTIPIGHRNRLRKIEKDLFVLIRRQANPAAMARVKIQRESVSRPFLRPLPRGAMN